MWKLGPNIDQVEHMTLFQRPVNVFEASNGDVVAYDPSPLCVKLCVFLLCFRVYIRVHVCVSPLCWFAALPCSLC